MKIVQYPAWNIKRFSLDGSIAAELLNQKDDEYTMFFMGASSNLNVTGSEKAIATNKTDFKTSLNNNN